MDDCIGFIFEAIFSLIGLIFKLILSLIGAIIGAILGVIAGLIAVVWEVLCAIALDCRTFHGKGNIRGNTRPYRGDI